MRTHRLYITCGVLSAEGCGVGGGGSRPTLSATTRELLKTAVNELSTNVAVGDGYITRGDACTIRVLAVRGRTAQTRSPRDD